MAEKKVSFQRICSGDMQELGRDYLFQDEPIVFILKSVLSLRSFNHEFTGFEKKHYPWSNLTKATPRPLK
jgi:hypothetical protein